jgi:hypothetical protein
MMARRLFCMHPIYLAALVFGGLLLMSPRASRVPVPQHDIE